MYFLQNAVNNTGMSALITDQNCESIHDLYSVLFIFSSVVTRVDFGVVENDGHRRLRIWGGNIRLSRLRTHKEIWSRTRANAKSLRKRSLTVISARVATTVGGIDIGDCDESAETYNWHTLVW